MSCAGLRELKADTNFWDVFELSHGRDGVCGPCLTHVDQTVAQMGRGG